MLWWCYVVSGGVTKMQLGPKISMFFSSKYSFFSLCVYIFYYVWSVKRKAFYKTDAGLEVRRKYREKAETKAKLIDELLKLNVSKKQNYH